MRTERTTLLMDKRFPFTFLITWNLRSFHLLRQVTIETPNYPGNYPDKAKCNWKIKVPANEEMHIWCETFDLLKGDFLRVSVRISVYQLHSCGFR